MGDGSLVGNGVTAAGTAVAGGTVAEVVKLISGVGCSSAAVTVGIRIRGCCIGAAGVGGTVAGCEQETRSKASHMRTGTAADFLMVFLGEMVLRVRDVIGILREDPQNDHCSKVRSR